MSTLGNARLFDGSLVDIEVRAGLIHSITPARAGPPDAHDVDLGGWLVLPAMAEPHAHLDKALSADLATNPTGDLMGAIDAWVSVGSKLGAASMTERATRALRSLVLSGATSVRSHVDVSGRDPLTALAAVRAAADAVADRISVQIVALVHSPLTGDGSAANRAALDAAVEAGVDVVGGCPHLEPDPQAMIDLVLDVAADTGLVVDLHVDETLDPTMCTLELLARAVIDRGLVSQVTASHCVSLSMMPVADQQRIASLVAEAGIGVVALPQTNLFLQARDMATAPPRGLTAISALRDAGVNVAAGADNVQDPFNLMGRSDPLETAALLVMAGHLAPDVAYSMVSAAAHSIIGSGAGTIEVGALADLVAIDAASARQAMAEAPMARRTLRAGRLVAQLDQHQSLPDL